MAERSKEEVAILYDHRYEELEKKLIQMEEEALGDEMWCTNNFTGRRIKQEEQWKARTNK